MYQLFMAHNNREAISQSHGRVVGEPYSAMLQNSLFCMLLGTTGSELLFSCPFGQRRSDGGCDKIPRRTTRELKRLQIGQCNCPIIYPETGPAKKLD